MPPTALAVVYCTEADIQSLLSVDGEVGRLDDTASGVIGVLGAAYLLQAISWATSRVNFYCLGQYSAADLATSWMVNNWAVVCAAHWLSCRRGNPPPGSYKDLYDETIQDLKAIKSGLYQIPEIGTQDVCWPAWSNVRVDSLYALRRIRVQRPISERTPTPYPQTVDWPAEWIGGLEQGR